MIWDKIFNSLTVVKNRYPVLRKTKAGCETCSHWWLNN